MPWTKKNAICDRCGEISKILQPSFGKHICNNCKDTRPKKGKGSSGLIDDITQTFSIHSPDLTLLRVKKSNGVFGHYYFSHYPGSKGIPGRSLCYLIYKDKNLVGIIGGNSPPHNYKVFRKYFECDNDNCFVSNNVFRLIRKEKNLGTKVLKLFRETIKKEYEEKYGEKLIGMVTFVEKPRTGAMYKADNWDFLGMTQGKRMRRDKETWEKTYEPCEEKYIFGYKYKAEIKRGDKDG